LLCDGSAKSRATYAALFAAIGTNYGAGDGSTTFNVPDFRGRVPLGAGTGPGLTARNLGATGGEESHVLVAGEIPAHSHGVTDPGHTHTVTDPGHVHNITDPGHSHGVTDGGHSHGVTDNGHLHRMFSGNADFMVSGTSGGASLQTGGAFQQEGVPSTDNATTGISVNRSGTGLSVNTAHTGESVNSAQTGVGVGTAETGIATQNAGGGGGHNTMQPYSVVNVFIKT
jgi:microcystin-dependent protein